MLENQPNTQDVFLQVDQVHHEVVHIDDEPSFREVICKDMVHEHLKGRWRIALAKEHHRRFIKPIKSSESDLPLVSLLDLNIVVPPLDIRFGEILEMLESVNKVGDTREGINVLDGVGIDVVVVLTGTEYSILLQDKEEGRRLQGFQGEDLFLFEVLINEHFQGLHFLQVKQIVLHSTQDKGVVKFDGMIERLVWRKGNFGLLEHIHEI